MFAIASLVAVMGVSLLITRVATVILVATGMSLQSARFQARSAFTGAGFTTGESEAVVDHPLRRRVIMSLMLLGNAGIVAAASTLILGFRGGASGAEWTRVLLLIAGLLAIVYVSRSRWVDRRLTALAGWLIDRFVTLPHYEGLLAELPHGRAVVEVTVRHDDGWAHRRVDDIVEAPSAVLTLERSGEGCLDRPDGETVLEPGDTLVVYRAAEEERELQPAGA